MSKPVAIWIDDKKYRSIASAARFFNLTRQEFADMRRRAMKQGKSSFEYMEHEVSWK